jgi:hypothetical protein
MKNHTAQNLRQYVALISLSICMSAMFARLVFAGGAF